MRASAESEQTSCVQRSATAAYDAFRDYSRCPGGERAQILRQIADGIEQLGDALIQCVSRETSLPEPRILGERARTCAQLRSFAALAEEGSWADERIDLPDPSRQPVPKPSVRSLLRPVGPVAIFGASNFPLAFSVAGGDTASALAVGCPVIFKAHPAHPETSRLVGEVIRSSVSKCGLPQGVFSLLELDNEAAQDLIKHPVPSPARCVAGLHCCVPLRPGQT
jgi:alpha-ketoglutaric semialdehyde dehydrogenase